MHILVAEDDPVTLRLLERIVAEAGHSVTAVPEGQAAWNAFQSGEFELVLLDWMMPGLSGVEVCRLIRASPRSDDTLIIMVTGRDSATDLLGALDEGADDYLTKPVVPDALRARLVIAERRLEQMAERRRTQQALERAQRLAVVGETSIALQHEINNPLSALIAYLQLAEMSKDPTEMREALVVVGEQAQRIAEVIRRLKRLSDARVVDYLPGSKKMLDLSERDGGAA